MRAVAAANGVVAPSETSLPHAEAKVCAKVVAASGAAKARTQVAVEASTVPALIPHIKEAGGSDIVVTTIKMLVV